MKDINLTKLSALTAEESKKILAGMSPAEKTFWCLKSCNLIFTVFCDFSVFYPQE